MPLRISLRSAASLLAALAFFFVSIATDAEAARPNILFVYTDDQAAWALGASGNPDAHTPNMDRLAAEGVLCTNAFVTTPVCSPARATLLTSRHGTELGITDWICPEDRPHRRDESMLGLYPGTPTWARDLQSAGYATALIGKWHLGTQDVFHPTNFGYDYFYGFREGGAKPKDPMLEVDGVEQEVPGLTTDILTDAALAWMRKRDAAEPFLLSLHYRAPHGPWLPVANEDLAALDGKAMTVPEPDFPDLDTERVQRVMREYLASVAGVDRNLGRVLALLDELGIRDNTIVIFTSDHGYSIGHHGLLAKGNAGWITHAARGRPHHEKVRPNLFDHSLRVPLIVRWPEMLKAGAKMETVVTNLDWYPTLLAMAGLGAPTHPGIRGRDFLPLLRGETISWDETFYGEYSIHHYAEADLRMIRTPEGKLVRDYRNPGKDEAYDLATDPEEHQNQIGDIERSKALDTLLRANMRAIGGPALPAAAE